MIDFEEELKKFHPSLEVEQVEDNVYKNKPKDVADLLEEMLKEIGQELGIENLQFYTARHSFASISANEVKIDRWTVNLMLNHTDQSMRVTELYIKRDFTPINEANFKLLEYIFGSDENL